MLVEFSLRLKISANQGLREHLEPVSCTSKLCRWNVPRNIRIDPKPVHVYDINITKFRFGREADKTAKSSLYDPRAPSHRQDCPGLPNLSTKLSTCLTTSSYFLFYDISPKTECEGVIVDSSFETVPENAPDFIIEENIYDLAFKYYLQHFSC
jgi:hypothetical protein